MLIVIWKKNGMRLQVLECFEGKFGEPRLMVCKETCPEPLMGRFSVRVSDTSLEDYMAA